MVRLSCCVKQSSIHMIFLLPQFLQQLVLDIRDQQKHLGSSGLHSNLARKVIMVSNFSGCEALYCLESPKEAEEDAGRKHSEGEVSSREHLHTCI
ncbi:Collagen Alpha-1(Xvi) Chain [Manis pentadactyla]|nr:Collagen Alpha-1(Xvi) Chain [Manis pentadactyla]